jgi:hypothetical protein
VRIQSVVGGAKAAPEPLPIGERLVKGLPRLPEGRSVGLEAV